MDTSILVAHILGISFSILGISMLCNKKWTTRVVEEMVQDQGILWISGLIAVMLGAVLVVVNNMWTSGLPLFVTIVGWLVLIKGACILIFPRASVAYYKKMNKGSVFVWGGVIVLVLGLLLLFV